MYMCGGGEAVSGETQADESEIDQGKRKMWEGESY